MTAQRFRDRTDAGRLLATHLGAYAGRPDVLVLALPRGGVPVAAEVAHALGAPLDVYVVRKLGVPGQEELAMGAIATGGVRVLNDEVVAALHIPEATIAAVAAREAQELARREQLYRGERPAPAVRGRVVLVVDDGLATGATMRAAVAALRKQGASRIIVAVPVVSRKLMGSVPKNFSSGGGQSCVVGNSSPRSAESAAVQARPSLGPPLHLLV